ncbi:phospho-acceptor domain-containing protein [Fontibacillus phaseoli]|uniref:histidine kinase n=1 Tax=Fontibacillus phaseoli TaxID=1416533 RepID=A0A369B893_9BACL|nr:sensor histidine kinase [Fontibacillus phaseoli]RCX17651.1 phospho-acceptor domain-containing protein [Fontibacillus phaseoli]
MIWFFVTSTALLGIAVIVLWARQRKRSSQFAYIHGKLNSILDKGTNERLMIFDSDAQVEQLLIAMNRLLDQAHRAGARYANQEIEIRRMLSNISHDLKTPLTVVLGYSEILLHDHRGLAEREREAMTVNIHDKAQEVLHLVHSFFDLAKLEAGDTEMVLTRVNASELCRLKLLSFYDMLASLGMGLEVSMPDEDLYVMADAEALERVLDNLITNAMKYGADGKLLGLMLERSDEGKVAIQVWDKGKGIPENEHHRVFERMYTLEDSRNRLYQGSGLGLTITKRLVERMGGTIGLHSVPRERTVFTFFLKSA